MWKNFFAAGGFGMFPVSLFGFLLVASAILYAVRPERRTARVALVLGLLTFAAGLLGAFVGICNSAHFIPDVPHGNQLEILALGVEESLHDVVLALILVLVGGLVACVGAARKTDADRAAPPARA